MRASGRHGVLVVGTALVLVVEAFAAQTSHLSEITPTDLFSASLYLTLDTRHLTLEPHAQRVDSLREEGELEEGVDPVRLGIVGGASIGGFVVGHVVLTDLWWKGEQSDFHFNWTDDWRYALGADKVGHAVMPYIATDMYRGSLEWTGLSHRASLWTAAGLSWTYMAYVEVRDGFSAKWGFSWGDLIANTLGVGWRVAEDYAPAMQQVQFKISYWPSDAWRAGLYGSIVDDYESTYHWASFSPELVLPDAWDDIWPDWLNLAVGHTVEGIAAYDGSGRHRFYLALDLDAEGLPGEGSFWGAVKRVLNYYHLPSVAIGIGRGLTVR